MFAWCVVGVQSGIQSPCPFPAPPPPTPSLLLSCFSFFNFLLPISLLQRVPPSQPLSLTSLSSISPCFITLHSTHHFVFCSLARHLIALFLPLLLHDTHQQPSAGCLFVSSLSKPFPAPALADWSICLIGIGWFLQVRHSRAT